MRKMSFKKPEEQKFEYFNDGESSHHKSKAKQWGVYSESYTDHGSD